MGLHLLTIHLIVDGLSTIGEYDLMDKLRVAATAFAERAARSRPLLLLRPPSWQLPAGDADGERGQGLAEYALILAGIAVVAIASLVFLGQTITDLFWAPIDAEFGRILTDILGLGPPPPP